MDKLVFIIDDDPVYLQFMKSHFRQMTGFVVEEYSDGDVAISELASKTPFMIIQDHNLKDSLKDGIHYLKQIKKVKPSVPVLYITSDSSDSLKQEVLKNGAKSLIVKSDSFLIHLRTAIDEINQPKKKGLFAKLFK